MLLRIGLVAGLVLHKVVWELMKPPGMGVQPGQRSLPVRLLKLTKIGILGFLIVQTLFLDVLPISDQPETLRLVGLAIFTLGLTVAVVGRIQLGENWENVEDYRVRPGQDLVATGLYRYIRHPIYAGDMLLLTGLELALNSWLVLGVIVAVLVFVRQALAEEAILAESLPGYAKYREKTKRFIPFII